MRARFSRSTLFLVTALCFALVSTCSFAQDADRIVTTEQALWDALGEADVDSIEVSGDISLTKTLVISGDIELFGADENASLTFSADVEVSGDLYSQTMIQVTGAEVTFSGLNLGMDEVGATSETWFWSLVSVENGAALTLDGCGLYADDVYPIPIEGNTLSSAGSDYDREALNGVVVEEGSLTVTSTDFFEFGMAGIVLSDGAHDISVSDSAVDDSAVGILNLHTTADDYDTAESALTSLSVVDTDFSNNVFGIVLLPNATSIDIAGNTFDGDEDEDEELLAGIAVLPVGIADFPGLLRAVEEFDSDSKTISLEAGSLLDDIPVLGNIHDLLTTYLVFPDEDSQVSDLIVHDGNTFNATYVGAAFVGCHDDIMVSNNTFNENEVGAVVTGFPGTLLGQLLDAVIDAMEGSLSDAKVKMTSASGETESVGVMQAAASGHSFPDYSAYVTFEGNDFEGNSVGAAVALNAGARFGKYDEAEENRMTSTGLVKSDKKYGYGNDFGDNDCAILLANGPGDVTVQNNSFYDNELAIGDVGYQALYNLVLGIVDETVGLENLPTIIANYTGLPSEVAEDLLEDVDAIYEELEAASASTLLVEGNRFTLGEDEGIWLLNDRVSAVIRQNEFNKVLGTASALNVGIRTESGIDIDETSFGSSAIRVGISELEGIAIDCVPARASIVENGFYVKDIFRDASALSASDVADPEYPSSFVLFDLADASLGQFDLHLNRFHDLEELVDDSYAYAVVNLGEDELDGSLNLWLEIPSEYLNSTAIATPVALPALEAYQHVYGLVNVSPVLTDEALDDDDYESTTSGDVVTYTGSSDGIGFQVDVASADTGSLILKPVTEEEASAAFTDEELADLNDIFFLPLDIRTDGEVEGPWTFRFENVQGFTNDNLVVKTTTARGVVTWEDNAYISDDGKWIVLEVGSDTTPSLSDFTGSVTMTASKTPTSSGSGSGGCAVGFAPVSALLLLLPLMGLKR